MISDASLRFQKNAGSNPIRMRRVFRKRDPKAPCCIVADRRSGGVGWRLRCDRLTHRPITIRECQRTGIRLIGCTYE
ncbi:unnamed protein product, partial [Iphiclides podalirius]